MEKTGRIYELMKEHSDFQIDLGIQNKISDLIEQGNEYDNDLKSEKDRELIDDEIAKNFEIRGYINEIIDYIESNEGKLSYSIVYNDLNKEVREVLGFTMINKNKFINLGLYSNFFYRLISELGSKRFISLGVFKKEYKKELFNKGINISDESFYLKMKNELFDLINELNYEFIYNIKNEINEPLQLTCDDYQIDSDREIDMNNANLKIIFELIDEFQTNKKLVLGDIKKGYFSYAFEYIQEFLDVNSNNIQILMSESIYYSHFLRIILLIANDGKETVEEIENYIGEELSVNMSDKVIVNKAYYDEMKEEIYELVKNLNFLLQTGKNN